MRRLVLSLFVSILISSFFSGCSKDEEPIDDRSRIEGLWTGTYTENENVAAGPRYFSFVIKPEGKLIVDSQFENKQQIAVGTWTLSGNTITCTYNYVYLQSGGSSFTQQTATATWDESGKLTAGTWKNTSPNTYAGNFTLTKVE